MPPTEAAPPQVLRFGVFELDISAGELRRSGSVVRLQPQPFQVLRLLVSNAGDVVDRDTIRRRIWGDTAVDFDRSLNVCVTQIRSALNDDADGPRYIQTLPRRGYRFLASVERIGILPSEPPAPATPVKPRRWWIAAVVLAVIAAWTTVFTTKPSESPIRIAILPFDTVGVTPGSEAQIDGLFDELLTRIGGIQPSRLRVIGRSSVARFRTHPMPLRELGNASM